MIRFEAVGNFSNSEKLLKQMKNSSKYISEYLDYFGKKGVDTLRITTPKDTGKTAASWSYKYYINPGNVKIEWNNDNINEHCNIALLIQYGHATGSGAYIEGVDYINPAMRPIFEEMAYTVWKGLTDIKYEYNY